MDNKLSELSKPVDFLKSAALITARNFERWSILAAMTSESSSVLHSTTLLETAQLLSALLAELEAKTKHIADMEHVVAAAKCDDELWDAMAHRLKTLEDKLATPVRLPDLRQCVSGDRYQWSDGVHNYRQDAIATLREQGFTVGDE